MSLDRRRLARQNTHTYVIGQPGTGKTRAIESWAMQDILAGRGVGVIDPHGDLFQHLLARLASKPRVWERVAIINPLDPIWTVGINPLSKTPGTPSERTAGYMLDVILKVWNLSSTGTPRMTRLLSNTFLALTQLGLSLIDLPRILTDKPWREGNLGRIRSRGVKGYFQYEFPRTPAAIHQWVTPVLNKIGPFLFDPDIQPMLKGKPTFSYRELLDTKRVLLVNVPKGILGEGTTSLMAAFIVAQIQQAALSRTDSQNRPPFHLYLDEFQHYTTDNITDVLAEARKYSLSLTLAHQYLDQLSPQIKRAVLNTSGRLVSFRVGYQDGYRIAKEIFSRPDVLAKKRKSYRIRPGAYLPRLSVKEKVDKQGWESLALELASLRQREFWMRHRLSPKAVKQHTFHMPTPKLTKELRTSIVEMVETSGQRFGRLKHGPENRAGVPGEGEPKEGKDEIHPPSNIPFWHR